MSVLLKRNKNGVLYAAAYESLKGVGVTYFRARNQAHARSMMATTAGCLPPGAHVVALGPAIGYFGAPEERKRIYVGAGDGPRDTFSNQSAGPPSSDCSTD